MKDEALFHLLNWIALEEGNRTLDEIVSYASDNFPSVFNYPEMEQAAEHCRAAGWIKVLTPQDCAEDRIRWRDDPHQNWSERGYHPGCVDFTPDGWAAFTALEDARAEREPAAPPSMTRCLWRTAGCVSILSLSEQELREELTAVRAGQDSLTGNGLSAAHTVGEIAGPYPIGPWWVKRFVRSPVGYRLDLFFSPPDMNEDTPVRA